MAREGRCPAFLFYPDSWLSSRDVDLMGLEGQGAYIRLLCYQWLDPDCGLPADDGKLAGLSRLGKKWRGPVGTLIRSKFKEEGGRLYNERLREEYAKLLLHREKSSLGGKTSAKRRRAAAERTADQQGGRGVHIRSLADAVPRRPPDEQLSSPISVSTSKKTDSDYLPRSALAETPGERLRAFIRDAMGEEPTDDLLSRIMNASDGASEDEVIQVIEAALRAAGKKHAPRHFKWFETVTHERFHRGEQLRPALPAQYRPVLGDQEFDRMTATFDSTAEE